jgi:hypothetical protein
MIEARSITAVNHLTLEQKEAIYKRFIPPELFERFNLPADLVDEDGNKLLTLRCRSGSTDVVVDLRHEIGAEDPLLFAHLTDTMNGQIHVLLYILNDPASPRFNVDRLPDGTPTEFGSFRRNIPEEIRAMKAGLAPGQVRSGLRLLRHSISAFEQFVVSLGHEVYFVDPLAYHNAITFEGYGFSYQQGRRRMEKIHAGFEPGGEFALQLDGSTPFRLPEFRISIRGRSWAIHDGILGEPYSDIVMYKAVGKQAHVDTFPEAVW